LLTRWLLPGTLVVMTVLGAGLLWTRLQISSLTVKLLSITAAITILPVFVATTVNNVSTEGALRAAVSLSLYTSALKTAAAVDSFVD